MKARAAQPLLTKENYDTQYSFITFDDFCKQQIETIGSEDNYLPKMFQYSYYKNHADYNNRLYVKSRVSSISDLFGELSEELGKYLKGDQQRTTQYQGKESQWTPEHISRLLNIEIEENEGVEGNLQFKAGPLHKFIPYSNRTIAMLPEGNNNNYYFYDSAKRMFPQ